MESIGALNIVTADKPGAREFSTGPDGGECSRRSVSEATSKGRKAGPTESLTGPSLFV